MKKVTNVRRHINFSLETWKQVSELCELWGENLTRVVSRAIQQAHNKQFPERGSNRGKGKKEKS